jgi:magnesium chelatase subunit D
MLVAHAERVFERAHDLRVARTRRGRRTRALTSAHQGKYRRSRLPDAGPIDLAIDATVRAAALRHSATGVSETEILKLERSDLRRRIRTRRTSLAIVFLIDNSYSIHADRMVERAKGLTWALLEESSANRDRVGVVAFRGTAPVATVALPLTRDVRRAQRQLNEMPVSGRTPLADGLRKARLLLRQEILKRDGSLPLLVVITDGLPTIPMRPGGDPLSDVLREARAIARHRIATVVADTTDRTVQMGGCCPELARAAGGERIPFDELVAETVQRG